jgi:hypothetical protein
MARDPSNGVVALSDRASFIGSTCDQLRFRSRTNSHELSCSSTGFWMGSQSGANQDRRTNSVGLDYAANHRAHHRPVCDLRRCEFILARAGWHSKPASGPPIDCSPAIRGGVTAEDIAVSWNALLRYATQQTKERKRAAGRFALILDEFPSLVDQTPKLPSILQAWWDREAVHFPLLIVLCGSQLSAMAALGQESAPLFGRFNAGIFHLDPLHYEDVAAFYAGSPRYARRLERTSRICQTNPFSLRRFPAPQDLRYSR